MATWDELFAPVLETAREAGITLRDRPQQRELGTKITCAVDENGTLIAEAPTGTGKSFAALVPVIAAVKDARERDNRHRAVVSTETTALQDQLVHKDLPLLHKVYGGFGYRALKGRSWYLCLDRARVSSIGDRSLKSLCDELDKLPRARLGDGERRDVEAALGRELDGETWSKISGESAFCSDNACKPAACWSTRARALALEADIVVTNHAMLRTDADLRAMQSGPGGGGGSLLGEVDTLIVDEAHTLEAVLVDGWTRELKPWDLWEKSAAVLDAIERASGVVDVGAAGVRASAAFDLLRDALEVSTRFFKRLDAHMAQRPQPWKRVSMAYREYVISGGVAPELVRSMDEYERTVSRDLASVAETLGPLDALLRRAAEEASDMRQSGVRKIRKGARAAAELSELLSLASESVKSRTGVVARDGVPYGVLVDGVTTRREGDSVALRVVPLDVSGRARALIWKNARSRVLMSATLADPISGDMRYTRLALGLDGDDTRELVTRSPFEFRDQQLVYVTPGDREPVPVFGAQYSLSELVDVINASAGRTLVLFTANEELAFAADELRRLRAAGEFSHELYVQEPGVDKQKLVEAFRRDESSVLLGSKSFMTGVDFPGRTCSTVVLAKMTMAQYNALCKMKIDYWRTRGYPSWYERESLLVFSQAVGRLIRTETDHGVVAVLDRRASDPRQRANAMIALGVRLTGSQVTSDISEIERFLK